jgi:hypothetical protein
MLRPEPFHRNENDQKQHQPDTQSERIERQRREILLKLSERIHESATVKRPAENRLTAHD